MFSLVTSVLVGAMLEEHWSCPCPATEPCCSEPQLWADFMAPSSHGIQLDCWLAFPGGAALLLLLPDTSHEIINFTGTSYMMRRGQQKRRHPGGLKLV